ncbi:acyl-CoA thioesterase domain-containing protein [Microbacterium sp. A93]|uniref:PaaI family thioesterase n=1 Tax=Microbacterium sp. A93 TaxID=3450716 RepID=UPI003F435BB6
MTPSAPGPGETTTADQPITTRSLHGALSLPLGRVEQLMRIELHGAFHGQSPELTGSMASGPWGLDADHRPSGLAAASLMDHTLATSIHAAAPELVWIVTTELQLNFLAAPPTDGTVLEAWTACAGSDPLGGMAHGTLRGPDGKTYVQATGWFQTVGPTTEGNLGLFRDMASLPLGPETEVPLDRVFGMRTTTPPAGAAGRPPVTEDFHAGPDFPSTDEYVNPQGAVHGGAVTVMAGLAAQHAMPDRTDFDLQSLRVMYLRPTHGAVLTRTRVRHAGRSVRVVDIELHGADGNRDGSSVIKPFVQAQAVFRTAR